MEAEVNLTYTMDTFKVLVNSHTSLALKDFIEDSMCSLQVKFLLPWHNSLFMTLLKQLSVPIKNDST